MVSCRSVSSIEESLATAIITTPAHGFTNVSNAESERLKQFINDVTNDLPDLAKFYDLQLSRSGIQKLGEYLVQRHNELGVAFDTNKLDQQGRVDWLLAATYLKRNKEQLAKQWMQVGESISLLGEWVNGLVQLCERRQQVISIHGREAASILQTAIDGIEQLQKRIRDGVTVTKEIRLTAFRAATQLDQLRGRIEEWYSFYRDFDPLIAWWTRKPFEQLRPKLQDIISTLRRELVAIQPGDEDVIVGLPIGREGILAELAFEVIAYTPEELLRVAEKQYAWCEHEAKAASQELGFGDDWRQALEHIKDQSVEPGEHAKQVHRFAEEAIQYVTGHDLVTVPEVAANTWRTQMMSAAEQKVTPFFYFSPQVGGIAVAAPTTTQTHEQKVAALRANSAPFARATVLHELIPGHHLQTHYLRRHSTHRQAFLTPFWMEGWAFYWELRLWERGYTGSAENKLGMLFWHMHRAARVEFSLKFHLGLLTAEECVELLVRKVGHERATAEGEVRRSFNGDYPPLYQAAYLLGALQLHALWKELVRGGQMGEKEFHDRVLKEGAMPVELLRALLKNEDLGKRTKASWRFYDL